MCDEKNGERENDKFELIPRAGGYIRNVEVKKKCNNAETEEGENGGDSPFELDSDEGQDDGVNKQQFHNVFSTVLSTVMCLAAGFPVPEPSITVTKIFLESVKDNEGGAPHNTKGILKKLENYSPDGNKDEEDKENEEDDKNQAEDDTKKSTDENKGLVQRNRSKQSIRTISRHSIAESSKKRPSSQMSLRIRPSKTENKKTATITEGDEKNETEEAELDDAKSDAGEESKKKKKEDGKSVTSTDSNRSVVPSKLHDRKASVSSAKVTLDDGKPKWKP